MRRLLVLSVSVFLFAPLAFAQEQANVNERHPVSLTIINSKGKIQKNLKGLITLESEETAREISKTGQMTLMVQDEDILHMVFSDNVYSINVGDADSLVVKMNNKRSLGGYFTDNTRDLMTDFGYSFLADNQHAATVIKNTDYVSYASLMDYIVGRVPGVQVQGNSLLIRGPSSINSGTDPLVVIDGAVAGTFQEVNVYFNPRDIESVTIDKMGSAYGVRGANGVIMITTKSGKSK